MTPSEITVFERIIAREIHADVVYEDDLCLAFRDVQPVAPHHYLLIPKVKITNLQDISPQHAQLLGHMMCVVQRIAYEHGLDQTGYRLISNVGNDGGQTVYYLHFHIVGGRAMGWPPG